MAVRVQLLLCYTLTSVWKTAKPSAEGFEWASHDSETAGWKPDVKFLDSEFADLGCNFEIRDPGHVQWDAFKGTYFKKKPVVFRFRDLSDRRDRSKWLRRPEIWTREGMIAEWGDEKITYGKSTNIVSGGGDARLKLPLKEVVEKKLGKGYYLWQRIMRHRDEFFDRFSEELMFPQYEHVMSISNEFYYKYLIIGDTRTGAGWHHHWDAWVMQIYNHKAIWVYPPGMVPRYMNWGLRSGWEYYDEIIRRLPDDLKPPYRCVLHPNDILYLPEHWSHLVVNIGMSVAISSQGNPEYHADYGFQAKNEWQIQHHLGSQPEKSIEYCNVLLDADPHHWSAIRSKAEALITLKKYDEARVILEEALKHQPHAITLVVQYVELLIQHKFDHVPFEPDQTEHAAILLHDILAFDPKQKIVEDLWQHIHNFGAFNKRAFNRYRKGYRLRSPKKSDSGETEESVSDTVLEITKEEL